MNPNITINITVTSPEAAVALLHGLTQLQGGNPSTVNVFGSASSQQPAAPYQPLTAPQQPAPQPANYTSPYPPMSVPQQPAVLYQSVPMPQQAAPVQPPVQPPVQTPTYTLDQLARAATPLIDSGKQQEIAGLLGQFGVQALTQLPKEQYGAFATALRGMGAKI